MCIKVYTDGACSGNPGPGGWASIIILADNSEIVLRGNDKDTTNNRMELTSVIEALRYLVNHFAERPVPEISLYSDSQYVVKGVDWAKGWRRNNWVKPDGKPALNKELWEVLLPLAEKLNVNFVWVRGHNGNPLNERCDQIAVEESVKAAGGTPAPAPTPSIKASTNGQVSFAAQVEIAEQTWNGLSDEQQETLCEFYYLKETASNLIEKAKKFGLNFVSVDEETAFTLVLERAALKQLVEQLLATEE